MAIGGVISAAAKTHTTLLVGRVLVGIGMSPAECLAGILVADLFYVVSSIPGKDSTFRPLISIIAPLSTNADFL